MADCELLATCGFFKKHKDTKQLACEGFIKSYCKGPKMNDCERKKIRAKTGQSPDPDMMPNGLMIQK